MSHVGAAVPPATQPVPPATADPCRRSNASSDLTCPLHFLGTTRDAGQTSMLEQNVLEAHLGSLYDNRFLLELLAKLLARSVTCV